MSDNKLKVPFFTPSIGKEEEDAVLNVMRSGWLTTGKYALQFEKDFSDFVNGDSAIHADVSANRAALGLATDDVTSLAVNSNTSGMILALEACGVGPGTAVITTPYTFVSTATCVAHLGADVYFADVEKNSYNIDCDAVERLLEKDARGDKKIRVIVPVHIAGNVCNMKRIMQLAKKYNVRVMEDAAHSFPALTSLGYAGTIGDVGVYSFYVTKTITTGEGGMITTRDPALAKRMTTMRMHGMDRTTWDRYTSPRASWEYDIIDAGYKFNLPDLLAALGVEQLKKANLFFEQRKKIVDIYNDAFSKMDFVQLPPDSEGNAWHLYLLRVIPEKLKISRDVFAQELQKRGIGISVHFIPLFRFTYWKNKYADFRVENFPNAERKYLTTISIPLFPDMTREMADYVISCVKEIGEANHA